MRTGSASLRALRAGSASLRALRAWLARTQPFPIFILFILILLISFFKFFFSHDWSVAVNNATANSSFDIPPVVVYNAVIGPSIKTGSRLIGCSFWCDHTARSDSTRLN